MNKQQLASKIWSSANSMRSKIEADEYKDYILGFIFYKFLCEKQEEYLLKNHWSREEFKDLKIIEYNPELISEETVENFSNEEKELYNIAKYLQRDLGYYIPYKHLLSTWLNSGRDFDISFVRDALSSFTRLIGKIHKNVFDKIFDTLQQGLSKLGDNSNSQTKAVLDLLELIKDIPMDGKQDYDVLGFIYEYLISMFAANAGKKAGEFYTPHEVSVLMSEIIAHHLQNRQEITIYDPTSGSGSLLINIGQSISKYIEDKNKIKYYAQELKDNTYNLTRMNLVMRGILGNNIEVRNADTLEEDWPEFDKNGNRLYLDAVVSNPPYSQPWDPTNKENDPRYERFGLAPKSKADYAFLLHDLYHIKPDGIMAIVLPHGVLFRGNEEEKIRKNLIEQNHIDTIIGLPSNIFFGTGIPTIIMILKQKRENNDVLIIDASKGFIKAGKNNKLQASDIKRIVDTVISRKNVSKYAKVVSKEEIRENGYNLNISRYVDSSEKEIGYDIYASMFGGVPNYEINELNNFWDSLPSLKNDLFNVKNSNYSAFKTNDIENIVRKNDSVNLFIKDYIAKFGDFDNYLKNELINNLMNLNVSKLKDQISKELFKVFKNINLIDQYKAYQLLDDAWTSISNDLEVIQTEGFESIKKVDPNLVLKKKNGKETEVQEGWLGHILPFDLIKTTILKAKNNAVENMKSRLEEIGPALEEIIQELDSEELEANSSLFNENNDEFVKDELAKFIKGLKFSEIDNESFEAKMLKASKLIEEEKNLKRELKQEIDNLELLAKKTIENLSDEQTRELLFEKWIKPLISGIHELPNILMDDLILKLEILNKKYENTLGDLEKEISSTENAICSLLDELEGDEFDLKGLEELKKILKEGKND
ncbi:type I restriction-modification system subunit M [Mycoplasma struthionis]|uniref:site-specific DNA-methyltransferase (adenine-specific) n=1 Tax=Mycoplasma struthionis TaxID=538220 RepID=A0A3G8LGX2_9MOLU|nr:type I restriction-modification system subunit M [Mycoplasma struthionis]AZG68939.1 type I restriction-modification system subunit M [Mycoplasma struthionis]